MGKQITEYFLYRWRYVLGYVLIGLVIVGLFTVAGLYAPGGLSQAEMRSVITSNSIAFSIDTFDPTAIVNLPYQLLQRGSMEIFGISNFSIKLPSLILGLLSVFGMLLLLRAWFRGNVAVIATILVITTGQFLFVAQSGTPSIIYIFWSIWLLVSAMMISRHAKWSGVWKIVLFSVVALSLYTPLSIYILAALLSAVILHPHLRYLVRRLSKVKVLLASLWAILLVSPLIYIVATHPSVGLTLLGIPDAWPNFQENALQLLKQYLDFYTPSSGTFMTPIYGLGSVILILLGILHLVTTKYTARSYIISAWVILLLPVLILNPDFISVTFVPIVLLIAMGIHTLLGNWYEIFPRNPYARLAGLIPLAVLIGGLVFSGVDRYVYGYLYDPLTASNFSQDLKLARKQLASSDRGPTTLVVTKDEAPFYTVVADHYENTTIATSTPSKLSTGMTIISTSAYEPRKQAPSTIVTDARANDSARFYIYKSPTK